MMYTSCITALFLAAASLVAADQQLLSINTPKTIAACQPVVLTWQGGKSTYDVLIVPGDSPCDDALVDLGRTNNTWLKWETPTLKPGTKVIVSLTDADEDEVWSKEITIASSDNTACVAGSTSAVDGARTGTVANVGAQPTAASSSGSGSSSSSNGPVDVGAGLSAASPNAAVSLLGIFAVSAITLFL